MQDLLPFLAPRHFTDTHSHLQWDQHQWGSHVQAVTADNPDWSEADIVILGCGERRGHSPEAAASNAPDAIRRQLYALYQWHPNIKIADAGDIAQGASLDDTRAALRLVLQELHAAGKTVIVLGGSHDLTLQQYDAFKEAKQFCNAVVADLLIDLDETETITDRSFLLDLLTADPAYVRHYTHLGFQSYYVQPRMLETLDKLRFDLLRVGRMRDVAGMEEAEPALRSADLFSFDISCVRYCDAPANIHGSPNGFSGDEACTLTRYAGAANGLTSFGIYGYNATQDIHEMTARLIAQMIWYFAEGYAARNKEAALSDVKSFAEFHLRFSSHSDITFRKSRRTGRWWMQLPDMRFVPCTHADYLAATRDELPERWLREQERLG